MGTRIPMGATFIVRLFVNADAFVDGVRTCIWHIDAVAWAFFVEFSTPVVGIIGTHAERLNVMGPIFRSANRDVFEIGYVASEFHRVRRNLDLRRWPRECGRIRESMKFLRV